MKKIKFFAAAMMLCAAGYFGYTAYQTATMTDQERMFQANLEALTQDEQNENGNRKLTVCLCSDNSDAVQNGYYEFGDMKNHCHDGTGNACTSTNVYDCEYTWYCNL